MTLLKYKSTYYIFPSTRPRNSRNVARNHYYVTQTFQRHKSGTMPFEGGVRLRHAWRLHVGGNYVFDESVTLAL